MPTSSTLASNAIVSPTPSASKPVRLCRRCQCGDVGCGTSGKPTYDNTDCCINGVLNNQPFCADTTAAPCKFGGEPVVPPTPHWPTFGDAWPTPTTSRCVCVSFPRGLSSADGRVVFAALSATTRCFCIKAKDRLTV